MILLIDNYDSFSYNLYQMIGEIEPDVKVVRNDEISVDEIRRLKPERIILSPGTRQTGRCRDTHRSCKRTWERNSNPRCLPGTSGSLRGLWSENYLCKKANARKAVSDKSRYRNVVVFRLLTEHFGLQDIILLRQTPTRFRTVSMLPPPQKTEKSWRYSIRNIRFTVCSSIRNPL